MLKTLQTMAASVLVSAVIFVLVFDGIQAQTGPRLTAGICPAYQTTDEFTNDKIATFVGNEQQMVLWAGSVADQNIRCQRLVLHDSSAYTYYFTEQNGQASKINGYYTVSPSNFKAPGRIQLSGLRPGLLGADVFGSVTLFPLITNEVANVFATCTSYGLFHSENVYSFLPGGIAVTRNMDDLKETLNQMGIPLSSIMYRSDQACEYQKIAEQYPPSNSIARTNVDASEIAEESTTLEP